MKSKISPAMLSIFKRAAEDRRLAEGLQSHQQPSAEPFLRRLIELMNEHMASAGRKKGQRVFEDLARIVFVGLDSEGMAERAVDSIIAFATLRANR
jgi:hypothetical protein